MVRIMVYNSSCLVHFIITKLGDRRQKGDHSETEEPMGRRTTKAAAKKPQGDFMEVGKEVVPGMRLRRICRGHTGTIGRIAWSPCGRFIASPSEDKSIRIWDANDATCRAVLEGHDDKVYCVAWSPTVRC